MTQKNDGGPAFPHDEYTLGDGGNWDHRTVSGMTLRDWFAGQAMAGIMFKVCTDRNVCWSAIADDSYRAADAMLEARK